FGISQPLAKMCNGPGEGVALVAARRGAERRAGPVMLLSLHLVEQCIANHMRIGTGGTWLVERHEAFHFLAADQDSLGGHSAGWIFRPALDQVHIGWRLHTLRQTRRFRNSAARSALDRDTEEIPRLVTGNQQRLPALTAELPRACAGNGRG